LGSTRAIVNANGDITAQYNYYPFGKQWKDSNLMANTNRWGFNGKEKQTVSDLGWLDFMARMYANCEMPIFTTQDPLAEKYYSISPYAYCGNNPINRIDPNGMDWYYFDQNNGGNYYQKQEQEGKHRMVVRSENENSITYTFYDFNDPDVDAKGIENGEITKMEFLSDEKVENMIDASGVKMSDARNSPLSYAWRESSRGKMDYAITYGNQKLLKTNTFYIRENIAYNIGDIGNYLWGRGMAELGIALPNARLGAHVNNILFGRKQESSSFNFGPGTYNGYSFWDSDGDQRSIVNGYLSSPEGRKWLKIHKKQNEEAMEKWNRSWKTSFSIY
jgi:RHS repeat-associated protein